MRLEAKCGRLKFDRCLSHGLPPRDASAICVRNEAAAHEEFAAILSSKICTRHNYAFQQDYCTLNVIIARFSMKQADNYLSELKIACGVMSCLVANIMAHLYPALAAVRKGWGSYHSRRGNRLALVFVQCPQFPAAIPRFRSIPYPSGHWCFFCAPSIPP